MHLNNKGFLVAYCFSIFSIISTTEVCTGSTLFPYVQILKDQGVQSTAQYTISRSLTKSYAVELSALFLTVSYVKETI